jgi:hypothetical protein
MSDPNTLVDPFDEAAKPVQVDEKATRAALDAAVRAHAADKLDDSEVIVNWIVLAGTRNHLGSGYVIVMAHDIMPRWEAEGVLRRGLKNIDAIDDDDTDEEA